MKSVTTYHPDTDSSVLIEAARRQDEGAVIALIERCERRIVAAIEIAGVRRYDSSFDDARNLALLEIWKQFPKLHADDAVCFWMHGIARRVTASRVVDPAVRQRKRDQRYRTHSPSGALTLDGPAEAAGDRDMLGRVLAELKTEHREVLVLRYLEGFSEIETAKLLHVPVKTVSSRTTRAKRAAMDALTALEQDDE